MPPVPPEAEAFLRAHTRTFLVTVRPDGSPACHPMVGLWRDGALYLTTYRKSAKARNLLAEPRVACVVVTDDAAPRVRAVVVRGRAEPAPPEALGVAASGARRPAQVGRDVAGNVQAQIAAGKRMVVRVVAAEVRLVEDAS